MAMEFKCPITQQEMEEAVDELTAAGIILNTNGGKDIEYERLRDYCIKATEKLTNAERIATICLSGLCLCAEKEEE